MRITQVMMTKGFGGAERSFVDTVLALANRGHQVQAICQPTFVKRNLLEENPNITLSFVKQSGWWDELAANRIRRAILDFQPVVVHAHLARGAWLAGRAIHRLDIPLVAKLHNYANLAYYRYINHFIGTTEDQRRYLQENSIPNHRISVIPNFSRLTPIEIAPTASECTSATPCTLITCGRLNQVKGFDILLRAFRLALDKNKHLRLIIGGEGEEKPILKTIIAELNLQEQVELAGWIDDVPTFLDRGDVYVVSSRSESFGIALLEAMSRGLPVVSTRTKGPSQILSDENAWFAEIEDEFSLMDALLLAALQTEVRNRRGHEMVSLYKTKYYEDSVLGRFEELYETLATSNAVPAGFQKHDRGQMLIRTDSVETLKQLGANSVSEVMNLKLAKTLRDVDGRCTGTLGDAAPQATVSQPVYLKRHQRSQEDSTGFLDDAHKEFAAILKCEQLEIPVAKAIACGSQQAEGQSSGGSFLITEEAGKGVSADELSHCWRSDPDNRDKTAGMRNDLIEAIAETTHKLHAAKLYHQDLYWSHFFPTRSEDGNVIAEIIDVQRMTNGQNLISQFLFQLKDLAQIRFSMEWVGLDNEEMQFFYDRYFGYQQDSTLKFLLSRLMPALVWIRSLGRLTKLKTRRRKRTHQETVKIELGSGPYLTEIPTASKTEQHPHENAA